MITYDRIQMLRKVMHKLIQWIAVSVHISALPFEK